METLEKNQIEGQEKQIVFSWLKSNGYNRVKFVENDGVEIEADSSLRNICVHVKVESHKRFKDIIQHKKLVKEEVSKIKSYGHDHYREPWLAVLKSDSKGMIDNSDVLWINLSK